jgi:UDP-2,3-diacylglucosamine hydrolase
MTAIVFSDVHLRDASSVKTRLVVRFLQEVASKFENIYILGDLFDIWPGTNEHLIKTFAPVIDALKHLVDDGHQLFYVEGNHDFLLGKFFSEQLGITVYPDAASEVWGDQRVFLTHGDMANPKQVGYRILRRILRNPLFQGLLKIVPPEFVFKAGLKSSSLSRSFQKKSAPDEQAIRNTYRKSAQKILEKGYDVVLMGHTHLPEDIRMEVGGRSCRYLNTGDWIKNFTYVEYDGNDFTTKTHPVKSALSLHGS